MEQEEEKIMVFDDENNEDDRFDTFQNIANSIDCLKSVKFMSEFLNNHCITISGIAEIAKKTPQAVHSMIKCNEGDFPLAYNIHGTNFYVKDEVVNWLMKNNKIARNEDDVVHQEYLIGTRKIIAMTGGPGNAKSTICVFAANSSIVKTLKKIFTGGGSADTENLIQLHFKKSSVNYVIFHYGDACNDTIPIKITDNNADRIKYELKKCKTKAQNLRKEGKMNELQGTYVELVLQPNEIISRFMNDCNIQILTFIDTPGIDDEHSGESVSIADIVVVALGDRDDIKTVATNIKKNIVPKTGVCQYIYLYNNRFLLNPIDNSNDWESVYNEYFEIAKEDLNDYKEGLKELKDELVIGTTLSACNPFESLICVPNFGLQPSKIDEFFFSKFCDKMKYALSNSLYFSELSNFNIKLNGNHYIKILNEKLTLLVNSLKKCNSSYDINTFILEKHGRTKSNDNYRIEYSYNKAMSSLKNYFYNIFKDYKTNEVDDEYASVIRMVYLTISEGLMNKAHYGEGSHPWEDLNSPTQMICEEILSKKIVQNTEKSYCQLLKENGIVSKSWNYVYTNSSPWNYAKILISDYFNLPDFIASNMEDYIKICHFLPSILVQSVLVYFKIGPSEWENRNYDRLLEQIMNDISI